MAYSSIAIFGFFNSLLLVIFVYKTVDIEATIANIRRENARLKYLDILEERENYCDEYNVVVHKFNKQATKVNDILKKADEMGYFDEGFDRNQAIVKGMEEEHANAREESARLRLILDEKKIHLKAIDEKVEALKQTFENS